MREYTFSTTKAADLQVEIGSGSVTIDTYDLASHQEARITVTGAHEDEIEVRQDGEQILVRGPQRFKGFFGGDSRVVVTVSIPNDSRALIKTGSADITVSGRLGPVKIKTGSGDVAVASLTENGFVESGSGTVSITVLDAEAKVRNGSGDVRIEHANSTASISTGSGDIQLGHTAARVDVKTGSGSIKLDDVAADAAIATGSGRVTIARASRGKLSIHGASCDVRIGVIAGTPVWTDINTVTGRVHSLLEKVGAPADGQDHVEIRAITASGDVTLVPA